MAMHVLALLARAPDAGQAAPHDRRVAGRRRPPPAGDRALPSRPTSARAGGALQPRHRRVDGGAQGRPRGGVTERRTMTTVNLDTIDWEAAHLVAQHLGAHTRNLVAVRDPEPAIEWALQQGVMDHGTRSISYYELAVILG